MVSVITTVSPCCSRSPRSTLRCRNGRAGAPQTVDDHGVPLGGILIHRQHTHARRFQELLQLALVLAAMSATRESRLQLAQDHGRERNLVCLVQRGLHAIVAAHEG
jgi:hypothetical protein